MQQQLASHLGLEEAGVIVSIRIGISGWQYAPWRGVFYPKDLPQRQHLSYVANTFPARYITHMRRLRDVETPLANFFASGPLALRDKLGPLLWQFPPGFRYERERMLHFFDQLPRDTIEAARLARRHERWLRGRVHLETDARRVLRHAVEIRNDSFADELFIGLLRDQVIALVIAESARRWPMLQDVTADFVYLRLHGDKELYRGGYASRQRDVYCFLDNTDVKLRAPFDTQSLMRKLRLKWAPPPPRRGS